METWTFFYFRFVLDLEWVWQALEHLDPQGQKERLATLSLHQVGGGFFILLFFVIIITHIQYSHFFFLVLGTFFGGPPGPPGPQGPQGTLFKLSHVPKKRCSLVHSSVSWCNSLSFLYCHILGSSCFNSILTRKGKITGNRWADNIGN